MRSSTWRQPFDKWPLRVIKMPPKPKGKKSQSNAKHSTEKTTRQKKKAPSKKPPAKTGSRASETSGNSTRAGQKGKSTGAPLAKRSKTRRLTAADIPGIVLAVVEAMPQSQDATSSTPRRSSRRVQDTTDQASQSTRSHSTPPVTDPQDSTNEEDAENEDFGKSLYIVCIVLWQLIIGWHATPKLYITHTMLMLLCNAHHSLIIMCIMPN